MPNTLSYVYCPNNFQDSNRPPILQDSITLVRKQSDTTNEIGMAIIDTNGRFMGWIQKY
ncbi:hypothetical protein EG329_007058 [Mollisiaceae sp. DMI_Dod_QoI]|nr:hypothetical protein EG329_007058 [Helotiales sp. DMI_Dod_QoI]